MNIRALIEACEMDLREGRPAAAAQILRKVRGREVPRAAVSTVANLCRRANLDKQSLRLLSPFVRSEKREISGLPEEIAEYAAALLKIGGVREAMVLLREPRVSTLPQASLFLSFCHFRRWEYAEAVPLLERYAAEAPTPYAALVGRLNLAAALAVAGRYEQSLALIAALTPEFSAGKFHRLLANALELRAQVQISAGDFAGAHESLNEGFSVTGETFYLRKWSALLRGLQTGDLSGITSLRQEARANGDWESLREADYFELQISFAQDLFRRLMFGTPHLAYRARVTAGLRREFTGESFLLGRGPRTMRLTEAPTAQIRSVLLALTKDFYAPSAVGALFAEIFPGEHFDIFTSPNRVHQLLFRTREWLRGERIPARVTGVRGQFALRLTGDFAFEIERGHAPLAKNVLQFNKLASCFKNRSFTNEEAQAALGISASTCKRLVRWALEENKVTRSGLSRATTYKIA